MRLHKAFRGLVTRTPLPEIVFRHRARGNLCIIAYHRIHPRPESVHPFDDDLMSATPEEFERELNFYRRHLDVLSIRELHQGLTGSLRLPKRPAVITFDDGYHDNHEVAAPLLRGAGLRACFFLSTGLVGTDAIPWWDQVACCLKMARAERVPSPFGPQDPPYAVGPHWEPQESRRFLHHLKQMPWEKVPALLEDLSRLTEVDPRQYAERPLMMSWEAARDLVRQGMDVGGHTRTHPVLSRISDPARLHDEISGCYADLRRELGTSPIAFSYPVGSQASMSEQADREIRRAGFHIAFSYLNSFARLGRPSTCALPRVHTEYGDDYHAFRLGVARTPLVAYGRR